RRPPPKSAHYRKSQGPKCAKAGTPFRQFACPPTARGIDIIYYVVNNSGITRHDIDGLYIAVFSIVSRNNKTAINVVTIGRDFESFAHPQDVVGLSQRPLRWRFRWHGSLGRIPFAAALGQPLFDHAFFLIREGIITQKFAKTSLWLPRWHYSAIKNARNSARMVPYFTVAGQSEGSGASRIMAFRTVRINDRRDLFVKF